MTDREKFEEWAVSDESWCAGIERHGDSYKAVMTAASWVAWQAGIRSAATPAPAQPEARIAPDEIDRLINDFETAEEGEPKYDARTNLRIALAESNAAWFVAVLAECMSTEGAYNPADPAATLRALIDWHVANERGAGAAAPAEGAAWQPIESVPATREQVMLLGRNKRLSLETGQYARNVAEVFADDGDPCPYTHWAYPTPAAPKEKP